MSVGLPFSRPHCLYGCEWNVCGCACVQRVPGAPEGQEAPRGAGQARQGRGQRQRIRGRAGFLSSTHVLVINSSHSFSLVVLIFIVSIVIVIVNGVGVCVGCEPALAARAGAARVQNRGLCRPPAADHQRGACACATCLHVHARACMCVCACVRARFSSSSSSWLFLITLMPRVRASCVRPACGRVARGLLSVPALVPPQTYSFMEKKQTKTYREIVAELEAPAEDEDSDDESVEEGPIYNPQNVPLGWDGKPIPYWVSGRPRPRRRVGRGADGRGLCLGGASLLFIQRVCFVPRSLPFRSSPLLVARSSTSSTGSTSPSNARSAAARHTADVRIGPGVEERCVVAF